MVKSRILKVVSFSASGPSELASKQLPEDPFAVIGGYGETLRVPPYSLEQLVLLAETHPTHSAALEQKAADVVAGGIQFVPRVGVAEADDEQRQRLEDWWQGLFGDDHTLMEALHAVALDYETVGWAAFEVARDSKGKVGRLYHVPAHTLRAHADGVRLAQMRQGRIVWFKRWGREGTFRAASGTRAPDDLPVDKRANELLLFRKPSRRSTWYGIPTYVSAIGWIVLAITARDYNITFFEHSREPAHIFFITGLEEEIESMLDDLEQTLQTQHKDPHRNLIVPLTGGANVTVQRLSLPQNDMHFTRLLERCDEEIFIAHRMPPDRVGAVKRGFLGGTVAHVLDRIYRDSVVSRGQALIEDRLNRFMETEAKEIGGDLQWRIDLEELDLSDEQIDTDLTVSQLKANVITINEARQRLGLQKLDKFEDMTLAEFLQSLGAPVVESASPSKDGFSREIRDEILTRLEDLDAVVQDVLLRGDETETS